MARASVPEEERNMELELTLYQRAKYRPTHSFHVPEIHTSVTQGARSTGRITRAGCRVWKLRWRAWSSNNQEIHDPCAGLSEILNADKQELMMPYRQAGQSLMWEGMISFSLGPFLADITTSILSPL